MNVAQQCIGRASRSLIRTTALSMSTRAPITPPKKKKGKGQQGPLLNEQLIQSLMRKVNGKNSGMPLSAESIQVRLVIDRGPSTPPSSEVTSLVDAMETSSELNVDLIAVSLDKDPPVIKAMDYSKLEYRLQKQKSGSSSKGSGKGSDSKPTKNFKFRAKIADHDLERKISRMLNYLSKGHCCQITVSASRRCMAADALAAVKTFDLIKKEVGEIGIAGKFKLNEEQTYGTLFMQPNSKR